MAPVALAHSSPDEERQSDASSPIDPKIQKMVSPFHV